MGFLNPFTENLFQSVLTIDQLPEKDNLLSLLLTKAKVGDMAYWFFGVYSTMKNKKSEICEVGNWFFSVYPDTRNKPPTAEVGRDQAQSTQK